MDARTAESAVTLRQQSWLQRERASGRFYDRLMAVIGAFLVAVIVLAVWLLRRGAEPGSLLKPPLIALLLIGILLPAIALMALYARKLAVRRAEQGGLGSGRLHVRLVALFSVIAAVPTVLVAIFASLLFQSGLEFWFSDRARGMLENSVQLARTTYNTEVDRVSVNTVTAAGDLANYLRATTLEDPRFQEAFARNQVLNRNLSEAIIFTYGADKQIRALALVNPYDRPLEKVIPPAKIDELKSHAVVPVNSPDRIGAVTRLNYGPNTYLYAARVFEPQFRDQLQRASDVLRDYRSLLAKSRVNQLRFNAALLLGALVIVGLAIFTAMRLADRLVRPVGELVGAAGRVSPSARARMRFRRWRRPSIG
jgi:two-component system nitrogen regulation sensor histidine kinase NtrY